MFHYSIIDISWYNNYSKRAVLDSECNEERIGFTTMYFFLSSQSLEAELHKSFHLTPQKIDIWPEMVLNLEFYINIFFIMITIQKLESQHFQKCFELLEIFTHYYNG